MHDDNDKYLSMYCCQYVQYRIELAVPLVTRFFYFVDINNFTPGFGPIQEGTTSTILRPTHAKICGNVDHLGTLGRSGRREIFGRALPCKAILPAIVAHAPRTIFDWLKVPVLTVVYSTLTQQHGDCRHLYSIRELRSMR